MPPAGDIPHYIYFDRRCNCHVPQRGPQPAAFLAFKLGTDTLGVALNTHVRPDEGWEVTGDIPPQMLAWGERRYPAATRAWINDTISRHIHARGDVGRFPVIVAAQEPAPRFFTYTVMPRLAGDTSVYAAEYDGAAFAELLRSAMSDRDLLLATFTSGRPVRELVQLEGAARRRRGALFRRDRPDPARGGARAAPRRLRRQHLARAPHAAHPDAALPRDAAARPLHDGRAARVVARQRRAIRSAAYSHDSGVKYEARPDEES